MSKNKTAVKMTVRLTKSASRLKEWSELTGQSENATADFFCQAGLILIETNMLEANRASLKQQLTAMCDAHRLRKQAKSLERQANETLRAAKA